MGSRYVAVKIVKADVVQDVLRNTYAFNDPYIFLNISKYIHTYLQSGFCFNSENIVN